MLSWLIDRLEIETSLQHLSRYHQQWSTSIQGHGQASFHLVLQQDCHFHLLEENDFIHLYQGDAIFLLKDILREPLYPEVFLLLHLCTPIFP